jgi:hypothetical protein
MVQAKPTVFHPARKRGFFLSVKNNIAPSHHAQWNQAAPYLGKICGLGGTHEDARNNAEDESAKITEIVATEILEAFYAGLFLSGYAPEKYR